MATAARATATGDPVSTEVERSETEPDDAEVERSATDPEKAEVELPSGTDQSGERELPFRVLPVVDDANRGFWTSGADGRLRFSRCVACGFWIHPPSPRCPECGDGDLAWEAVSGRGEVFSYTVNHQPWDGSPEPWVIVLVAFPEQDGLRLTSNLLGVEPDRVHIGMAVEVTFEHHDDVWVPVFVPAGEVP